MGTRQCLTVEAGMQTELTPTADVASQAGAARPPPIPKDAMALRRRGSRVQLRTRQLVMRDFKETPHKTMEVLVGELLIQINPRGKGCCFLHIALEVMKGCISQMATWKCDRSLKPHSDWQCP